METSPLFNKEGCLHECYLFVCKHARVDKTYAIAAADARPAAARCTSGGFGTVRNDGTVFFGVLHEHIPQMRDFVRVDVHNVYGVCCCFSYPE